MFENRDIVVADGGYIDAPFRELGPFAFQLNQLAFTKRSPIGRTVEQ